MASFSESAWAVIQHSAEGLKTNIQESAEGWRMGFASVFGGDSGGSANLGGDSGIKAGGVSAKLDMRMPDYYYTKEGKLAGRWTPSEVPGTPVSVVERIQQGIAKSIAGWRMGFGYVGGKAKEAAIGFSLGTYLTVEEAKKAVGSTVGGIGESFGDVKSGIGEFFSNIGESTRSLKWLMYILVPILVFIAIMVAIGYSGVGAPAARVAEREYVKRR